MPTALWLIAEPPDARMDSFHTPARG